MMELLAPAGSPEAVVAAVQNGADAVYMGFGGFNARQGAKNFTQDEFREAMTYCRTRGCKVYVTLNTLISDRELTEAAALAETAAELGASAILIQDIGLLRVLKSTLPGLPLHASTQMSVHNLAGAQAAAEMGVSRVVLARELSLNQIRHIAKHSPIEVEVFVHGALCFCHSGQCYMSALIGRRSGNRGVCAQPCRLNYSLGGRLDEYPLSLKDNCLVTHLQELEEAGVACVKIEGRMKRPEYSAIVVGIYSRALRDGKAPTPQEMEQLEMAFSRQGFTDGYLTGDKGPHMFGIRGEPEKDANKLFSEARKIYSGSEIRRVPVDFYAVVKGGERSRAAVQDDEGHSTTVYGPAPEPARSQSVTEESVAEQMYKTGGTPFICRSVTSSIDPGLFLPAAALNEMRRQLIVQLTEMRKELPEQERGLFPSSPVSAGRADKPVVNYQVLSEEQLTPELAVLGPDRLYVPVELLVSEFARVMPFIENGTTPVAVLPRIITDSEQREIAQLLQKARELGVGEALIGNLGHIKLARLCGFEVRGDFGLNAFNAYSLEVLERAGLLSATASFELRLSQIRDMAKPLDLELIVYGRLPAMITDQCVIKNSSGKCACHKPGQLSDRMGSMFPVMREYGCRNVIYNAHKLFLADRKKDYESAGLWGARLSFTTESARECVEVAKCYQSLTDYVPNGMTRGLYYRGVE